MINIYTDGACSGNPGPGGWAAIILFDVGPEILFGGDSDTTNNRMEQTAIINALEYLKKNVAWFAGSKITIHSDSAYCVNAINNDWIYAWYSKYWKTSKGETVKNIDLWEQIRKLLLYLRKSKVEVLFEKVKGHNGIAGNELADEYARRGIPKIGETNA